MSALVENAIPDAVSGVMENYVRRGIFRGYSAGETRHKMIWHHGESFDLILDHRTGSLRMPRVLPNVPADSPMYHALKGFVRSRQSESLPEHRRIELAKAKVKYWNRRGIVGLTVTSLDGDYGYCTRKLIHLVHEIYLYFLKDGLYQSYLIETFNLDPDTV